MEAALESEYEFWKVFSDEPTMSCSHMFLLRIERLKAEKARLVQQLVEIVPIYDRKTAEVKDWTEKAGVVQQQVFLTESLKRARDSKTSELKRAQSRLEELRRKGGSYDVAKAKMKDFFAAQHGWEKLINELIKWVAPRNFFCNDDSTELFPCAGC